MSFLKWLGRLGLVVSLSLASCGGEDGEPVQEDAGTHQCQLGSVSQQVQSADRKILGAGARYDADATLRGRDEALARSQAERRAAAWKTVSKVLAPVPVAAELPSWPGAPGTALVPRWQTWYAKDDLSRMFQRLFTGLAPAARTQRARFAEPALDEAFGWNVNSVDELESWPAQRLADYIAGVNHAERLAGVGGIARVGYSPAAARHLMGRYPELLGCLAQGAPGPFVDGPASGTRRVVREPVQLEACATHRFGPYFVAGGETLHARLSGDAIGPGAQVLVRAIDAAGVATQVCKGVGSCEAFGPGTFQVLVVAGDSSARGALDVDYQAPEPTWAACLGSPFPLDAVVVKADWRRVLPGTPLPVYDTSAAGLAARLGDPAGKFAWGAGDSSADPGPSDIYTLELENGNVYRLAALHIMTKELDHWQWVTLWWSPPGASDADFGADRPGEILALGGPWRNYKMCTVTAFDERDPRADGGFTGTQASLGQALAAVHRGEGAPSWCSNPYLELGDGNADTNCMGCHQHAGTSTLVETILADAVRFPVHGRTAVRNNFPSDYSWAVDFGDQLSRMFDEIVDYWTP